MPMQAISPEGWKRGPGYSHAILTGDRLILAGVLPWNPATQQVEHTGFAEQWAVALQNIGTLVTAAGFTPQDVVSLRAFVRDLDAYRSAGAGLGESWGQVFGRHFPAITLVEVSRLVADEALLEIEGEAVRQGAG